MNNYRQFILPCSFTEFNLEIAREYEFFRGVGSEYSGTPHVVLSKFGQKVTCPRYCTTDNSIIVFDYKTMILVQTNLPDVEIIWELQAARLSFDKFVTGQSVGFFLPYALVVPYILDREKQRVQIEDVFLYEHGFFYNVLDANKCEHHFDHLGIEISDEDFDNLSGEKIGTVEYYSNPNVEVDVYDRTIAYIKPISEHTKRSFKHVLNKTETDFATKLLSKTVNENKITSLILPCTANEFMQTLYMLPFNREVESDYPSIYKAVLEEHGTLTENPMYTNNDGTLCFYDYGSLLLVETTLAIPARRWLLSASLLSIARAEDSFFIPIDVLSKLLVDLPAFSFQHIDLYDDIGALIKKEMCADGSGYFTCDSKPLSYEEFLSYHSVYVGTIESTTFHKMQVTVYDSSLAHVKVEPGADLTAFKELLEAELQ